MATIVVVGTQWGDEGKGKVTDFLAERADMVVRYQGGSNAGHTVVVRESEYRLHHVPSGILYPGKICVIGNGVVLDPAVLLRELEDLAGRGVSTDGLRISYCAHVVMPYHRLLDELEEDRKGAQRIGTTRRGIGPAYMDKFARVGIRVADLLDPEVFREKIEMNLQAKNHLLERVYGVQGLSLEEILEEYLPYAKRLKPYVADTSLIINRAVDAGKHVLFEGAQGTLLDIDFGTYPYVTSSHPVAGGACIGSGVGPTRIQEVIGVVKAYTSRVGEGPFPTELVDETGQWIREKGHEYGTTTGRPRRCGWLDAVVIRYAARVSGLTGLAVTRLDILGGLPAVRLGVAYEYEGEHLTEFPASLKILSNCRPVYEEFPGWPEDLGPVREYRELPGNARRYLERLEELVGLKIKLLSLGRERTQTIPLANLFGNSPSLP